QAKPPRGITPEDVALHDARGNKIPVARGDTFLVEGRAARPLRQMRLFADADKLGEYLLPDALVQKRRAAIPGGAANRAEKMPDQPFRGFRRKQHGHAHGGKPLRTEASQSALRRTPADGFRGFDHARVARRGIPVVALHAAIITREDRAGNAMTGSPVAADEAVRVTVNSHSGMRTE